jgi:hypothetical protein
MLKVINDKKIIYDFESILSDALKQNSLYIATEQCDGNLIDFFDKEHKLDVYKSLVFQICCMAYCLQKYIKIYHNSFFYRNILFKKINKNIVFNYKIKNVDYYVPSRGYLFVLIDFQRSKYIYDDPPKNRDIRKFKYIYHRPIKIIIRNNNITNIKTLLNLINIKHIEKIYHTWYNEKTTNNYKFYKTTQKRWDTLFTEILHLAINENLFDYTKFYTKYTEKIVELLKYYSDNIFKSKDDIADLLYKHFAEFINKPSDTDINIVSFKM